MTKGVMSFYGTKEVLNPESLRWDRYFANGQKRRRAFHAAEKTQVKDAEV